MAREDEARELRRQLRRIERKKQERVRQLLKSGLLCVCGLIVLAAMIVCYKLIFEKKKIQSPVLRNIIIFSSDNVIFSDDCPEVYSLSTAIEKMKVLSKGTRIPLGERLKLIRTIKKASVPLSYARAHNAKVLNMHQTGTNSIGKKASPIGSTSAKKQNAGTYTRPKS